MAELVAQGETDDRLERRSLSAHEPMIVGRAAPGWAPAWEPFVSRRHLEAVWDGETLRVVQSPECGNPAYFHGEPSANFSMRPGDCFVIGRTAFTLKAADSLSPTPSSGGEIVHSFTVGPAELRDIPFRDAPHRLDVLGHLTKVIFSIDREAELFAQTANLLLQGIRRADAVALVTTDDEADGRHVRLLHAERRFSAEGEFEPSRRLVEEAVRRQQKSVVHVWTRSETDASQQFTMRGNFDWAICTPLRGDACRGMALYVAGRLTESDAAAVMAPWRTNELSEDAKFAELVADILSALRQTQSLQHRQSVLSHFFSPGVLQVLATKDPETALRPTETDVTAMFCDLRGFSRKVEMSADNLSAILERVSAALGVMSTCILRQKGVVADFLGDCAMGFWGWPIAQADDTQRACLAALGIREAFEKFAREPNHPLADFKVGLGIAHGRAVAGQIGSRDQAKVTAFGPVVNLASRLEGLTKILHVPVLLDEETARIVRETMPRDVARCRRLAKIRPYGLDTPLVVSELLLPEPSDPDHTPEHLTIYEQALDAFLAGRWDEAYQQLHQVPAHDVGKDFLVSFILQHNRTPPPGWDGVIPIEAKR